MVLPLCGGTTHAACLFAFLKDEETSCLFCSMPLGNPYIPPEFRTATVNLHIYGVIALSMSMSASPLPPPHSTASPPLEGDEASLSPTELLRRPETDYAR